MTFLLMDTGGPCCVLALAEDHAGTVRSVRIFEGRRTLSRRLMGEMDALLRAEGLSLDDLSALAVGIGPGSFTGIRVGVTTARTLAQVAGKLLVGVGTLDAYAAAWGAHDPDTLVVPVLASRRNEVYAAFYQGGACLEPPFAIAPDLLAARLLSLPRVIVCGEPSLLPGWRGPSLAQPWTPPDGLARLAAARLALGETDDPLGLLPSYVVPPSISTPRHAPLPVPLALSVPLPPAETV